MILYDISREILSSAVYPGDPLPELDFFQKIEAGSDCNLSTISMCTHTGTHIDAPLHFDDFGKSVYDIKLGVFYGKCSVVTVNGILTGEDMDRILPGCRKRILFKGSEKAFLTRSAASVIADSEALLVGTDAMSIAADFDEEETHSVLAEADIAVLENLDLTGIEDGEYILCAFPLKMKNAEAMPCRAILLQQEKGL